MIHSMSERPVPRRHTLMACPSNPMSWRLFNSKFNQPKLDFDRSQKTRRDFQQGQRYSQRRFYSPREND
jgi:hypothetical protein